jgi:hypothetical protein
MESEGGEDMNKAGAYSMLQVPKNKSFGFKNSFYIFNRISESTMAVRHGIERPAQESENRLTFSRDGIFFRTAVQGEKHGIFDTRCLCGAILILSVGRPLIRIMLFALRSLSI